MNARISALISRVKHIRFIEIAVAIAIIIMVVWVFCSYKEGMVSAPTIHISYEEHAKQVLQNSTKNDKPKIIQNNTSNMKPTLIPLSLPKV